MQGGLRFGLAVLAALLVQPVHWNAPARAFELIEPATEKSISLVVGTGQLIKVETEFSSLFVANPGVADLEVKSPRLLYLTGVGVGETTLFAVDDNDNVLMSATIRVTHNTGALQRGIAQVAPGQDITAMTVDQSLVITGSVASPEDAANVMQVAAQFVDDPARVVNRVNVAAPTQVNLQVRIAEIARNVDRQLGIRWGAVGVGGGGARVGTFSNSGTEPEAGTFSVGYGYSGANLSIDVLLQALSEEGLVSVLAEPNLTALSGESASFLAGGEFPYAITNDDENTINFKDFGIGLNFTPTVLSDGRISLRVATEVSELNFANNPEVPALNTRRAETTVDLGSGQTFAIAGLIQNNSSQNVTRMPGLGSLPIIGALFRSNGFQRAQTELVIIVTPVIVKPTDGRKVRTPLDKFVPPNDFERIVLGRFQGKSGKVEQVRNRIGRRTLHGASGFVFE